MKTKLNENSKPHKHDFKLTEKKILLRDGGGVITAKHILKQRKCKCGKVETYDLERVKA